MRFADGRNETRGNPIEPRPRQPVSLTSTHQCMSPSATYLTAHSCQTAQITRHSMLVEIPLNHAVQPLAHNGDRFMPTSHQLCPDSFECRSHSLLHLQTCDLKAALAVNATTTKSPTRFPALGFFKRSLKGLAHWEPAPRPNLRGQESASFYTSKAFTRLT